MTMTTGDRIKLKRKENRLTQEDLAERVKVSPITVFRWEQGVRSPRSDELQKLAEALNTTSAYLLGDTDDPRPLHDNAAKADTPAAEGKDTSPEQVINQQVFTDKGTLIYEMGNGRKLQVPATPEYAPQFWAFVNRAVALQPTVPA